LKSMNVNTITVLKKSKRRSSKTSPCISTASKTIVAVFFLFSLLSTSVWAQKETDFILMLDVSKSMFQEKSDQVELLVTDVMKRQLSYRDSFHLISFGITPEFEISRELRDQKQIEEVLARLMLLQPLEEHTDIIAALKFLGEYTKELSLHSNKQILIISDDVHDPPAESSYAIGTGNEKRIENVADYFRRNGWKVSVVIFPPDWDTSQLETGLLKKLSELLGTGVVTHEGDVDKTSLAATGAVEIKYPDHRLQAKKNSIPLPLTFVNHGNEKTSVRLINVFHQGEDLLEKTRSVVIPAGGAEDVQLQLSIPQKAVEGKNNFMIRLSVEGVANAFPLEQEIQVELREISGSESSEGGLNIYYIFIPLLLLVFILIFFLLRRILGSSSGTKTGSASGTASSTTVGTNLGDTGLSGAAKKPELSGSGKKRAPAEGNFAEGLGYRKDEDESQSLLSAAKRNRTVDRVSPYEKTTVDDAKDAFQSFKESSSSKSSLPLKGSAEKEGKSSKDLTVLGSFAAREKENRDKVQLSLSKQSKQKSSQKRAQQKLNRSIKGKEGEIGVEMRADFQHNFLGRNMNWFGPGSSFSIGAAGEADFEITSIRIEGVIANIRRTENDFTLYPIQEDYFPELHGNYVENCLGRHFRVVSPETGHETALVFKKWIHPLERINRMLHITDSPGKPDSEIVD